MGVRGQKAKREEFTVYAYILIGEPATGKTTWRRHLQKFHSHKAFQALSYDDFILDRAKRQRVKPQDIYERDLPMARDYIARMATMAFQSKRPVIWDTHELGSKEKRKELLAAIPAGYKKIAVVFKKPDEPRTPSFVRESLPIEPVGKDEGFDEVRDVKM